MARPTRFSSLLWAVISLLLLIMTPMVLFDSGEQLGGASGEAVSPGDGERPAAPSFGVPTEAGEDFEDDFDDVLLHEVIVESSWASQAPSPGVMWSTSSSVLERLLRPPIG